MTHPFLRTEMVIGHKNLMKLKKQGGSLWRRWRWNLCG